jgi:hypothetical protein
MRGARGAAGGFTAAFCSSKQAQLGNASAAAAAAALQVPELVYVSTARGLYLSWCSHVCCCLLQVRGASLSLLQHLALQHTARGELEELLVAGPAGAALLTAVGRALATQPALFVRLAQLVQVCGITCTWL